MPSLTRQSWGTTHGRRIWPGPRSSSAASSTSRCGQASRAVMPSHGVATGTQHFVDNPSAASAAGIVLIGLVQTLPGPAPTGQLHHLISKKISRALDDHPVLKGMYTHHDSRFVTRAKDEASHRGYQKWHRAYDQQVVDWLDENQGATQAEFEACLKESYDAPKKRNRLPQGMNGCGGSSQ